MRSAWSVSFTSLLLVVVTGCDRTATNRENISKPADTVASAKASTTASAPIVVAVTAPRCDNGLSVVPIDPTDSGVAGDATAFEGLGLSGTGGWGEGIGLGTVGGGGWGPIGAPLAVKLKGQTLRVEGLSRDDAEKVVCAGYPDFMRCVESAATSANDLDGTIGLGLSIDDGGHVTAKIIGGTLEDTKLKTCMTEAAAKLAFAAPSSKGATVDYAFTAHRPRKAKVPKLIETGTSIAGRLPPEVIKRIIRASFPRLRYCYEQGLKTDPTLKGTVVTKFVIDTTGAVQSVSAGGGTMGNASVRTCVTKVFTSLSFPEPEGGKVTVTYPIDFQNES